MTHGPALQGALTLASSFRAGALADRIAHMIQARQALELHQAGEAAAAEYTAPGGGWAAPAPAPTPAPAPAPASMSARTSKPVDARTLALMRSRM